MAKCQIPVLWNHITVYSAEKPFNNYIGALAFLNDHPLFDYLENE